MRQRLRLRKPKTDLSRSASHAGRKPRRKEERCPTRSFSPFPWRFAIAAPLALDVAHGAGFVCAYKEAPDAPKNMAPVTGLTEDMTQAEARQRLAELVGDLTVAKMPPALIVDHLVWAYCPLVANDKALSDAQKTARLRRFAAQVAGIVYAPASETELDILVDMPVAPALLDQIDKAAKADGLSRDEWLGLAIEKALGAP